MLSTHRWRWRLTPVLLVVATLAACRGPAPSIDDAVALRPAPDAQVLVDPYPSPSGPTWLGGDVASSAPVDAGTWVWIFGDTLLGRVRDVCPPPRRYCDRDVEDDPARAMIPNSVGLMRVSPDGGFGPLEASWRTAAGRPAPIFETAEPDAFLWPLAVTSLGPRLLIVASRHTRAGGLFSQGNDLLRVENPSDPPPRWRVRQRPLPNMHPAGPNRPQLTWMTALVHQARHVYLFGELGTGLAQATVLARLRLADLTAEDFVVRPEYLLQRGDVLTWSPDFDEARLARVPGLPGTSEATIQHHPAWGWYTFRIPPAEFVIRLYTAELLTGPWRDRGVVYEIPAPWSTARRPDGSPRYAAYAAKAHPQLAPPAGVVVSYNVNLQDGAMESAIDAAEAEPDFYVPRLLVWPDAFAGEHAMVGGRDADERARARPHP
jgi:hypothetical protein